MHSRGSVLGRSRSMQARSLAAGSGRASVAHPCRRSTAAASVATAAAAPQAAQAASPQPEDKWIARTLAPLHGQPAHSSLEALRQSSAAALATARMPSTRNEEYRFTDITPLLKATVQPADASAEVSAALVDALVFPEAAASVAVVVNGVLRPSLSRLGGLPEGVYVGSLSGAPPAALAALGSLTNARGGPMQVLNGAAAQEVTVVSIPAGLSACPPLYVLHVATGTGRGEATRHGNAPRLLVHAGEGSTFEVVEEFVARDGGHGGYFTCAVAELLLEQNVHLQHRYVQGEADGSFHFRGTLVSQAAHSSYTHTEVSLGGALTRHDLIIEQAGSATHTEMRHFLLCGSDQLHDLHSKLELNHPNGTANQLHKCIVGAPTGRGVFDGNVKVNKRAQKTDAGQLSRNLLLVPRATVNVKPNLQIVADDVKCTHGCTVSDLSEEELFYFRARGISAESARQALVYSFGAECVDGIRYKALKERIQQGVRATLSAVDFVAAAKPAADGQ